jgi:hypothetical protein
MIREIRVIRGPASQPLHCSAQLAWPTTIPEPRASNSLVESVVIAKSRCQSSIVQR